MSTIGEKIRLRHPAQVLLGAFVTAIIVGAGLLMLPISSANGEASDPVTALFTATSALCLTGLIVVDTGGYWSGLGQVIILLLIQLGGLGIMTFASVLAILVTRKLGLRSRLLAQSETGAGQLGNLNTLLKRIVLVSATVETVGAIVLSVQFWRADGGSIGSAVWKGVFHSVSAYNNAGFSTNSDSMVGFQHNSLMLMSVSLLVIVGGIGYPVLSEVWDMRRTWRNRRHFSLHTKLTLSTTAGLLVFATFAVLALEWTNPGTIGGMNPIDKLSNAFFGGMTPRTAGFNSIDYDMVRQPTLLLTETLMLIGGGSASTAGGIKVTTFALLGFVVWAELRGDPEVNVFKHRVPTPTQREALSVALLGIGAVVFGAFFLGLTSDFSEGTLLFESVSALGTVGLSTGITSDLPKASELLLILLMLIGRLGPVTFGTALVLRARDRLYRYPEGRPMIG